MFSFSIGLNKITINNNDTISAIRGQHKGSTYVARTIRLMNFVLEGLYCYEKEISHISTHPQADMRNPFLFAQWSLQNGAHRDAKTNANANYSPN